MEKALLIIMFGLAMVVGGYALFLYQEFQSIINPDPSQVICKKGRAYYQINKDSTVYLKSNDECLNERKDTV